MSLESGTSDEKGRSGIQFASSLKLPPPLVIHVTSSAHTESGAKHAATHAITQRTDDRGVQRPVTGKFPVGETPNSKRHPMPGAEEKRDSNRRTRILDPAWPRHNKTTFWQPG